MAGLAESAIDKSDIGAYTESIGFPSEKKFGF